MPAPFAPVQKYPSKKNIGLTVFLMTILILNSFSWGSGSPVSTAFNLIIAAYFIQAYFGTHYTINDDVLIVRAGFLYKETIDISSVRKINKSYSWWSAPTLSPHRLEIFYNRFDSVHISPQNRDDFINHLLSINPDIVLEIDES